MSDTVALDRLTGVISWLAGSGMEHDEFDHVYIPLLAIRDTLFPNWWLTERESPPRRRTASSQVSP